MLKKNSLLCTLLAACAFIAAERPAAASSTTLCIRNYLKQWNGGPPPAGIALSDAEDLIRKIARSIGLVGGVTVVECEFAVKAQAWSAPPNTKDIPAGDYIIYDPNWAKEVMGKDRTQITTIFGHELGHLVGRHSTSRSNLTVRDRELEADRFAGCAVARTGGEWARVEDVLGRLRHSDELDEKSYPSANQSLAAAKAGFEDCGGTPGPVPSSRKADFVEYQGPPVNETYERLKTRYPSGKWAAGQTAGTSVFTYTTTVLERPVKLIFNASERTPNSTIEKVTFLFENEFQTIQGHRRNQVEGKPKGPAELCKEFFNRLTGELINKVGAMIDRPVVEEQDWSEDLNFSTGWCKDGTGRCHKSATAKVTTVTFDHPADVKMISRFDEWRRDQESPGTGEYFSNEAGKECRIWLSIDNPQAFGR